jgi:VanZ family protein
MAVIFAFSAQSNPLPVVTERVWDKLLHVIEYAGLAALVVRALMRERVAWRRAVVVAALVASAYGASDEYHQAFVPGRDSTPRDWAADTVGGLIGAAAYAFGGERRTAAKHVRSNDERQR